MQSQKPVRTKLYLERSWELYKKAPILLGVYTFIFVLIAIGVAFVPYGTGSILSSFVSAVGSAGVLRIFEDLHTQGKANWQDSLRFKGRVKDIFLEELLSSLLIGIGVIFFVVPGAYLSVAYFFSRPIVALRGENFWVAMEESRARIRGRWMPFAWLVTLICVIDLAALLPIAVGVLLGSVGSVSGIAGIAVGGAALLLTMPLTLGMSYFAWTDENGALP